jgi:PII-like signaling protein
MELTLDENPLMIMFSHENEKVGNVLPLIKEIIKEGIIIKENIKMA